MSGRAQAGTLILKHGKPAVPQGPFSELKTEFGAGSVTDLNLSDNHTPLVLLEKEDIYFTAFCAAASGIVNAFAKFEKI
ncbi:hypothetical protein CCP3SC15_5970002 [Gammaproteobacteria bacterium]